MAATVPVETEGSTSALLEQAMQIGNPAEKTADDKPAQSTQAEPRIGSYEAFMSSFGAPQRWAGR